VISAGAAALVAGTATAAPLPNDAEVVGLIRVCGGPPPGRCVHRDAVIFVIDPGHKVVASKRTLHGRFAFALAPGRYNLVATWAGPWVERAVTLTAHQTLHVNIVIPIK
jgi:hypothetical protein